MAKEKPAALLIVDVQNDFISGSLAVKDAQSILPAVVKLAEAEGWDMIVASQDYHPSGHISFASLHSKEPFQEIRVPHPVLRDETIPQMLWPDHCVQGTRGCEIEETVQAALDKRRMHGNPGFVEIIQKGQDPKVDGYSAFSKNSYVSFTPLVRKLAARGIERLFVVGLATDYCCRASALDARKFGFETIVVKNAMKGVDAEASRAAIAELEQWDCITVDSAEDALKMLADA